MTRVLYDASLGRDLYKFLLKPDGIPVIAYPQLLKEVYRVSPEVAVYAIGAAL